MSPQASGNQTTSYPRTGKRGVPQQFPRRLYEMLEGESNLAEASPEYNKIIMWSDSGKAFGILDVQLFASQVLPKYFRTNKFSSFQRNLNLYGFSKVRRGPDADMYAHPTFIRGKQELLCQLLKCNTPASARRNSSNSSSDGNSTERTASTEGSQVSVSPQPSSTPPMYVTLQSARAAPVLPSNPVINPFTSLALTGWNQPRPHNQHSLYHQPQAYAAATNNHATPAIQNSLLGRNKLALLAMAMTSIEALPAAAIQKA
mmetsp:Transcript_20774/g.23267  ORF Transcript_20774/g.23267 Transcript_20774/m.23267 type:complete len:259 (-) Transcript_20774:200-976(-)|eukprot:CAMPEP_0195291066 /NCGR_PEP_ID=MMETSP0707-20130614/7064_1 /TAXON_ID=33640 /ORGANISM="Asterionellopsis glacialis, Strain CCMP134" /LENGTH=258 /DNA_ID=CAMNT_0040351303 /DNA_START=64 /DNA_END=840 /DNA_ORIENTATION=+